MQKNASKKATVPLKKGQLPADPAVWTEENVGEWLEKNGLGKYKKTFKDQSIGGNELLDLTESELAALKLNPAERAKALTLIQQIRRRHAEGADNLDDESSTSSTASSSATSQSSDLHVKCFFGDDVRRCSVKPDTTLRELKRKIKRLYGQKMTLKYRDADNDLINLRASDDWDHCKKVFSGKDIKLELKAYERSLLHKSEAQVLEAMVDGVIMIDSTGHIYFINRSSEKLLGYTKEDLIGKNVNTLMASDDAAKHDGYLARYLATGEGHIIGKGRNVQVKRKDGSMFGAELSVSHTRTRHKDVFTGIIRPSAGEGAAGSNTSGASPFQHIFTVLQNLPQGSIASSEDGSILFVNQRALQMLGYSQTDLVGKNVRCLMPEPHSSQHDSYLKSYIRTGQARIIGRPRDLVAMCKDGSLLPVKLAVSEQWVGSQRLFTATIFKLEEMNNSGPMSPKASEKTVLQQERESVSHLAIAAVVIDQKGTIQAFNPAAEKLWGFTVTEVAGRNVKMLMSFTDAERHDQHIQRYLSSGKTKVIGTGRQVVAQKKNGDMFPVHLAVSERLDGEKKIWTGICQPL